MRIHSVKNAFVYTKNGFDKKDFLYSEDSGTFVDKVYSADADESCDASGCYVIPGLCDIHLHGADGADFSDGDPDALLTIASWEACHGTTAFCPASMTVDKETILKAMDSARLFTKNVKEGKYQDGSLSELLGVYMEGPFISKKKCGAQDPVNVKAPSFEFLQQAQQTSGGLIRFCVTAPEGDGAISFIRKAASLGIKICIGHTDCDYEKAHEAFSNGACELTHTFNAMAPMLHRAPGPVAAAAFGNAYAELIADGIHVHNAMIAMTFRMFGPDRVILISDSMRAAGLKDGAYTLGGQKVNVKGSEARLDNGVLAGSVSCLYSCLRNAVLNAKVPLHDAVTAASVNPRRQCGADTSFLGSGNKATFLVLSAPDAGLKIKRIVMRGKDISPFN